MQNKTIYTYDKTGKFVGEYPSISEAAKNFGPQLYISNRIKQVLAGKMKTVKGYYVSHTCYFKLPDEIVEYINSPNQFHYMEARPVFRQAIISNDRYKPYNDKYMKYRNKQQVYQYDPKGIYMYSYESILIASLYHKVKPQDVANANKRILKCMTERTKTGKHYKFNGYYFSSTQYNNVLKQN